MSDPQNHSESVEISSDDDNGQTTSHTQVVEDGKTVVDETHGPDQDGSSSSS